MKLRHATSLTPLLLIAILLSSRQRPAPAAGEDLVHHYAPVIYQAAASAQDYITAIDFDGDWTGNNNWENQPTGDLSAHVYYSIVETDTHWFIFYSLFHPRDTIRWGDCATRGGCHENDLESIQLVVEKDGSTYGRLVAMETLAHGDIFLYTRPGDNTVTPGYLSRDGTIRLERGHPVVFVETGGHGIHGHPLLSLSGMVVYRVGDQAQRPGGIVDRDVSYELVPIYNTLWAQRDDVGDGRAYDLPFSYRGRTLPATLDGIDHREDAANTPWGYDQATGDVLQRGDWFLDPAKALAYHASFAGGFSLDYVHNPYLDDLGLGNP